MKERLIQLLDLEQLTPSKFADIIGVQRSSISHVISGRNKPSFDFLQKTLKAFPGLNAAWLMLGEGSMYEQMGRSVSENLFDSPAEAEAPSEEKIPAQDEPEAQISASAEAVSEEDQVIEPEAALKKRIIQVMVFYEDDTFKTFIPEQ